MPALQRQYFKENCIKNQPKFPMQKVRIPEATAIAASDCYTQNRLCHTEKKLKNTIKLSNYKRIIRSSDNRDFHHDINIYRMITKFTYSFHIYFPISTITTNKVVCRLSTICNHLLIYYRMAQRTKTLANVSAKRPPCSCPELCQMLTDF